MERIKIFKQTDSLKLLKELQDKSYPLQKVLMPRHQIYVSSLSQINLKLGIYLFTRMAKRFCFPQIGEVYANKQALTLTDCLANVINSVLSL